MNDVFYEQFVSRKRTIKDIFICGIIAMAAVIFIRLGIFFLGIFTLIPAFFIVYAIVGYVFPYFKGEYEYVITNHFLDIAVIYNKENRKDKISIDIQKAEMIAPADSSRLACFKPDKIIDFTSGKGNMQTFSIIVKKANVLYDLRMEPDEEMLKIMKNWSGSKFYLD